MTLSLSLADQIALELRADIIGGRLLPGTPLIEAELVTAYNASRNTIRDALHRLGQEGLTRYVRNYSPLIEVLHHVQRLPSRLPSQQRLCVAGRHSILRAHS